jgi:hypothetical protein
MLPRRTAAPFDSPDHVFGPSWGGQRALAFVEPAVAESPDGSGYVTADGRPSLRILVGERDVAPLLPELAALPTQLAARSAILDGELVVVDGHGRADRDSLAVRLAGRPGPAVALLVFDLPYVDGLPILGRRLDQRRARLREVLQPGAHAIALPAVVGEGRALHDAVLAQGLAGTLARVRSSPYLPGVRSALWQFVPSGVALEGAGDAAGPAVSAGDGPARSQAAGGSPVLALIRRLPLPDEDEASDPG